MERYRPAVIKFLLPLSLLCVLGPGLSRAQNAGEEPSGSRVSPATPVTIQVDGSALAGSPEGTVKDVLDAAGVLLGDQDECEPALSEAARPGMTITVHRVFTHTVTETAPIPPRTRVSATRRLRHGMAMIQQHPREGLKELTYHVASRDGNIVARRLVSTRVVRSARDKVILVGGRQPKLPSRGGYFTGQRVLTMVATGYHAWVCGTGRTYLGMRARRGIVAVDPRVIPLGARVHVEGYGEAMAADIGSAIKGNRIDLCFPTYREASRYGLKRVKVRILSR